MNEDPFDRDLAQRLRRYESHIPAAPLPSSPKGPGMRGVRAPLLALATVTILAAVFLIVRLELGGVGSAPAATSGAQSVGPSATTQPTDGAVTPTTTPSVHPAPPTVIPGMVAFDGSPGTPVAWCWNGECAEVPIDFDHSERYEPITSRLRTSVTVTHVAAEALASEQERVALEVTRDRSEISVGPVFGAEARVILVTATFPSGDTATYAWRAVRGVQVGVNADREAILEPLVEIRPKIDETAAEIAFSFERWDHQLGIEGAILFLKATDANGVVVLDRMVDGDGDLERIPPGDYSLTAYYRTCDGNCAVLDPAQDFCSLRASFEPSGRHRLTVVGGPQACSLT
ncbi:MAG TPA: hypothetical protein VJ975_12595 [Candidatus Limnocylindria bacterium]|nr:hypothetical protein [Candidatus Limnocylindria bacterium]